MQLEEKHLKTFIELYEQKYGEVLEPQEALEIATKILRLVEIVKTNTIGHGKTN